MDNIDITTTGFFGGIGDGTFHSNRRRNNFPLAFPFGLDGVIHRVYHKSRDFLYPTVPDGLKDWEQDELRWSLFSDIDNGSTKGYDPYRDYMSGNYCDCCGKYLNPLIRSHWYTLCIGCDEIEQTTLVQRSKPNVFNETIFNVAGVDLNDGGMPLQDMLNLPQGEFLEI